ncbi:hypothetical protein R1sor_024330 [Riccia sorocarpa]|uniref:Uncharacterized protein n=1 Tax=Riccia sorocarpa TaxID=122646 RepID=A0ABD3GSM2_9MARC
MSPLYERSESTTSSDSPSNLATVAEQLVAELEKSAAEVAAMEVQLKNLKKYVKACDLKRKQVERKLLEAWEQDSKNQVKAGAEIMELQRQVHLKEAAYQELIRSRKALVAAKVQEINELKEDCRRREQALKDMSAQAQATNEASEKKLAVPEEICRKKDTTILTLKQEIFELEGKVQELQACQTPAQLRPMNLPPERAIGDDSDELVVNERGYRLFGADDAQVRSSFTSMCESETRRTSWGSDLSAQDFHIIDTPWSSELCADQDFKVIEEAAFQGRSLSIFQNVTSSQEFSRGVMRKFRDGGYGPASCGISSGMDSSATSSKQSGESIDSQSRDMKKVNSIIAGSRGLTVGTEGKPVTEKVIETGGGLLETLANKLGAKASTVSTHDFLSLYADNSGQYAEHHENLRGLSSAFWSNMRLKFGMLPPELAFHAPGQATTHMDNLQQPPVPNMPNGHRLFKERLTWAEVKIDMGRSEEQACEVWDSLLELGEIRILENAQCSLLSIARVSVAASLEMPQVVAPIQAHVRDMRFDNEVLDLIYSQQPTMGLNKDSCFFSLEHFTVTSSLDFGKGLVIRESEVSLGDAAVNLTEELLFGENGQLETPGEESFFLDVSDFSFLVEIGDPVEVTAGVPSDWVYTNLLDEEINFSMF